MPESRSTPPWRPSEELNVEPETGREARIHAITANLDADRREEFGRLCAAMGFEDTPSDAGKLIGGRYELVEILGSGGMGVVHLARDHNLEGAEVALKLVRASFLAWSPQAHTRLQQEAERMVKLRPHPNVVTLLDVGRDGASTYMVMELVNGPTLRQWLAKESPSRDRILAAYLDAARGLSAAHALGLVHCDFKPDNVLLGPDGVAKVTDFGVARVIEAQPFETQTAGAEAGREADLEGTLAYIAPEQLANEPPDASSDQFSFCVALWEAITGELPYRWRGRESQRNALRSAPAGGDRLPRWLARVLERGMALEPARRFPDMDAVIAAIERGRQKPTRVVRGTLGVFMVVGALTFGVWLERRLSPGAEATCERFVGRVESRWSAARREAIARRAEQQGVELGRSLELIDRQVESWTLAAAASCEGERAPAVDEPVRVCLERWEESFESRLRLLELGDELTFVGLPNMLASLPVPGGRTCTSIPRASDDGMADLLAQVEASWLDEPDEAERLSQLALARARRLAAGRRYDPELALAHIARADALRGRGELGAASEALALAHAQASALMDAGVMLLVQVTWAKVLAHMRTPEATARAALLLDLAEPLFDAVDAGPDEQLRAEFIETRALLERNLGNYDRARSAYREAARMHREQGNVILAARAVLGEGVVETEVENYAAAERLTREAISAFEAEGVPPAYPRLLQARFDLAITLFERSWSAPTAEAGEALLRESLTLFETVASLARAPLRLKAIASTCQVAAEIGDRELLAGYLELGWAALAAGEAVAYPDEIEAQLALSGLTGLEEPQAELRVESLIFSRAEPLEPSLRAVVAIDWIDYLDRRSRCEEVEHALARVREIDAIVQQDVFTTWLDERTKPNCN